MGKILDQKLWSHGTPLGYPRALFPKALPQIFPHKCFLVVLRVYKLPHMAIFVVDFFLLRVSYSHRCVSHLK